MKNILVLHGWCGYKENAWFPWFKAEMERRGYNTIVPDLPNAEFPVLEEQLNAIEEHAELFTPPSVPPLAGEGSYKGTLPPEGGRYQGGEEGGIIIGHSLGCKLALEFINKHNLTNVESILVAPSFPRTEYNPFFLMLINIYYKYFKKVKSYDTLMKYVNNKLDIKKLGNKFTVFLSKDDDIINLNIAKNYYSQLQNVEIVEFENKGHFNTKAGVKELDEVLKFIQ